MNISYLIKIDFYILTLTRGKKVVNNIFVKNELRTFWRKCHNSLLIEPIIVSIQFSKNNYQCLNIVYCILLYSLLFFYFGSPVKLQKC